MKKENNYQINGTSCLVFTGTGGDKDDCADPQGLLDQ